MAAEGELVHPVVAVMVARVLSSSGIGRLEHTRKGDEADEGVVMIENIFVAIGCLIMLLIAGSIYTVHRYRSLRRFKLLVYILAFLSGVCLYRAYSDPVTVAWEPPVPSNSVAGYMVYHGGTSGQYTQAVDAGTALALSLEIDKTLPYYAVIAAYNTSSNFSAPSSEAVWHPVSTAPSNATIRDASNVITNFINLSITGTITTGGAQ